QRAYCRHRCRDRHGAHLQPANPACLLPFELIKDEIRNNPTALRVEPGRLPAEIEGGRAARGELHLPIPLERSRFDDLNESGAILSRRSVEGHLRLLILVKLRCVVPAEPRLSRDLVDCDAVSPPEPHVQSIVPEKLYELTDGLAAASATGRPRADHSVRCKVAASWQNGTRAPQSKPDQRLS